MTKGTLKTVGVDISKAYLACTSCLLGRSTRFTNDAGRGSKNGRARGAGGPMSPPAPGTETLRRRWRAGCRWRGSSWSP